MITALLFALGLSDKQPQQTAQIRVMARDIWEPSWVRVQVLPQGPNGERRFFWPGPHGFEFDEHASFVEEVR